MKDREFYDPSNDWSRKKRGKKSAPKKKKKPRKGSPSRRSRSTGGLDKDAGRLFNRRQARARELDEMFGAIKNSLPKAEEGSRSKWVSHFKGLRPSKVKNFDRIGKGIKGMTPRPKRTPRKDRAIGKGPEQVNKPRRRPR